MSQGKLSRRTMLRWAGAAGAGVMLVACGGAPSAVPTPTASGAASTPKPAAAAQPAATPKPAGKEVTLDYWYWADDETQSKLQLGLIDKFQQKTPNIKVKTDMLPTVADMRKKLVAAFAAGGGLPDASRAQHVWLPEFNEAKMLVPLEDRLKGWQTYSEWLPKVVEVARVRPADTMSIVANRMNAHYLYYRTDWLDEAKLKPPDTMDDFLEVAKALNKPPDRYGFALRAGDTGGFSQQLGPWMEANGVQFVKSDGSTDWDSPEAIATVDWYAALYTKHKVTQPSAMTDTFPQLHAAFQGGKVAMEIHHLESWKQHDTALGTKASAVPTPKGKKTRWVQSEVQGTTIYSLSKQQDEAWQLATHMGELDQMRVLAEGIGSAPVTKAMLEDTIYKENRFFKAVLQSQDSWGVFPFWHVNWNKMLDRYVPEMQRVLKGEITAEQLCKTLADVIRKG